MSSAGRARIAAYVTACMLGGVAVLMASKPGPGPTVSWPASIERAQAALAGGDARQARRHWEDAYRDAVRTRRPDGLLATGNVALQIGEASQDRPAGVAEARRIYLLGLFQARERRDPDAVALAGRAFAALGDREVAERAFDVALELATSAHDVEAQARVMVLAGRLASRGVTRGARSALRHPRLAQAVEDHFARPVVAEGLQTEARE